jgi:hypothetical protein
MKNLYFQKRVCLAASCLLWATTVHAQSTATIYTPKGTAVTANIYGEMTSYQVTNTNNLAASQYPNSQRLADASAKYNCHAYAWYLSEAPASPRYWIENPGDDKYWQDGSYIQICNGSEAAKISYANGDHSAIRSTVAGKYDSKWGQWPLLRHDPTYTPYDTSVLNYYVPTTIVASSTTVCDNATFSVASFTGGTYTWNKSTNLTLNTTSGPSVVATNNGNGSGWVEVTISSPCSNAPVTTRLNVTVGVPDIAGRYYCTGCNPSGYTAINPNGNVVKTGSISLEMFGGPGVTYSFSSYPSGITTTSSNTAYFQINSSNSSQSRYDVTITENNGCGSTSRTITWVAYPSYYYAASPNPTTSELSVMAVDADESDTNTAKNASISAGSNTAPPFDAELYDSYGKLVKTKHSEDGKALLDVNDLPSGLYNLRVGKGKNALSEHIQITH